MAKIILLCGKVCSGKSRYAGMLERQGGAVTLSCDELMLILFDEQLGERHEEILCRTKAYLFKLAVRVARAGVDVILDFGFWTKSERRETRSYFESRGLAVELHYVKVSAETQLRNIDARNRGYKAGTGNYRIDEGMRRLFARQFEEPGDEEVDVLFENTRDDENDVKPG